jgi:hypothetical protein
MKSHQEEVVHHKIQSFWKWFAEHSSGLAGAAVPQPLVSQLEKRLFAIHRLDWEIGPGRTSPSFFALSPRGERELLRVTRSIVAQAPALTGWEFYPAKPPRAWNLVFSVSVGGRWVEIDGKQWEFIAFKFNDGTYDLVLKPDDRMGLSEEDLYWAAIIVADGELGEETRMDLVPTIEVVMKWEEGLAQSAKKLEPGLLAKVVKRSPPS